MSENLVLPRYSHVSVSDQRSLELNNFELTAADLPTYPLLGSRIGNAYQALRSTGGQTVTHGDSWTVAIWFKRISKLSLIAPTPIFASFKDTDSPAANSKNEVNVDLKFDGILQVTIRDKDNAAVFKRKEYHGVVDAENWFHLVIKRTAGSFDTYKNGSLITDGSDTGSGTPVQESATDMKMVVGAEYGVSENLEGISVGSVRNIRYYSIATWNSALDTNNITAIYNSGDGTFDLSSDSGNYNQSANLEHWWTPGRDPDNIGEDRGNGSDTFDLAGDSIRINKVLLVNDYPGYSS